MSSLGTVTGTKFLDLRLVTVTQTMTKNNKISLKSPIISTIISFTKLLNSRNHRSLCQSGKHLFADIFLGIITALFEISLNCNCNLEYLSYLGENEELTGTKVPHMKVTGNVTKFHLKSNFPIPGYAPCTLVTGGRVLHRHGLCARAHF